MSVQQTGQTSPLVVGTDRSVVGAHFQTWIGLAAALTVIAMGAAPALAALAASSGGVEQGLFAAALPLAGAIILLVVLMTLVHAAAIRSAAGEVLRLDAEGMHWRTPVGPLDVAWDLVTAVDVRAQGRHRILIFSLPPTLDAGHPGVTTTMKPIHLRRLVKRGLCLGSAGIDVPIVTVIEATSAFTDGRLVAR